MGEGHQGTNMGGSIMRTFLMHYLVVFVALFAGCNNDDGVTPSDMAKGPECTSWHFGSTSFCSDKGGSSIALDGTTITEYVQMPKDTIIHLQGVQPCGPFIEIELPEQLIMPCIAPDANSFVALWRDTTSTSLEIWIRTNDTEWTFENRIATFEDDVQNPETINYPQYSADMKQIIANYSQYQMEITTQNEQSTKQYSDNAVVGWCYCILSWKMSNGSWVGPDTLDLINLPSPDLLYDNPCFSPDGNRLFARNYSYEIPGYRIIEFEKTESGSWSYIGDITMQINPDMESLDAPFMAYDYSYFYYTAIDNEGSLPNGIYRTEIICDD